MPQKRHDIAAKSTWLQRQVKLGKRPGAAYGCRESGGAAARMAAMGVMNLWLASRSPRRVALLREAGYHFEQVDPHFDDPADPQVHGRLDADRLAVDLATRKAYSVITDVAVAGEATSAVVLGCDTICLSPDGSRLIGQPADAAEAGRMLRLFRDAEHLVITGVALVHVDGRLVEAMADEARVTFGHLNDAQIQTYLQSEAWRGKAGGYNLTDRQAAGWPVSVHPRDDPTTVVGLPMRKLCALLDQLKVPRQATAGDRARP